jgi:outer membrane murein-binding lipoprotein Lpp
MFLLIKRVSLLAAGALVLGHQAIAVPSPYVSKFGPLNVANQTNATLIRDNTNQNLVHVMPPTSGQATFQQFVPSANLQFCKGLQDSVKAISGIDAQIGQLANKFKEYEAEYKKAEDRVVAAKVALGEVAKAEGAERYLAAEARVDDISQRISDLVAKIEGCSQNCEVLREEYKNLREDLRQAKAVESQIKSQYSADVRAYNIAQNRVQQAESIKTDVIGHVNEMSAELIKLGNTVFDLYATRGKLEGGFAQIDYSTGWDEAMNKLRQENPTFQFEKIDTYNVKIFANFIGASDKESYLASLPAILDYSIDGVRYVPWMERDQTKMALPSRLSGAIRMSVIGACPIAVKNFFEATGTELKRDASGNPIFSISASYEYPVTYHTHVKADYNFYNFYKQIKKQGTHGGFFSSRSYSETVEDKSDTESFKITFMAEDPNSPLTSEKREEIRKELKAQMLDRALKMLAHPGAMISDSAQFTDAEKPPQTGAVVFAKGLRNTCGFNIYCQGASWILDGLQAIFGSSETEQRFQQKWDRNLHEEWSEDMTTLRAGATTIAM